MHRKPAVMSAEFTALIEANNEREIHEYFAKSVFHRTKRNMNSRYQKSTGETAIMYATSRGYFNSVRALLKYEDVDIEERAGMGYDLFNFIARRLETHGVNDQEKFNLLYAIMRLQRFTFNVANFNENSVLLSLAHNPDSSLMMKKLIELGADPNVSVGDRYPLYYAVLHNNLDVIKVLLSSGISKYHLANGCYAAICMGNVAVFNLIMSHSLGGPDLNMGRWVTDDGRMYQWEPYKFANLVAKRIHDPAYQSIVKTWVSHPNFDVRQFDSALLLTISVLARKHECPQLLSDVIRQPAITFNVTDIKPRQLIAAIDEQAIKTFLLSHPDAQRILKTGDTVLQDLPKGDDITQAVEVAPRKLVRTASVYSGRSVLYQPATTKANAETVVEEGRRVRFS